MIKVKIGNNLGMKEYILDGSVTIREALEQAGIDAGVGTTMLDGASLGARELDNTFEDYNIDDKCVLMNVVKADNAVTVSIVGPVAIIASQLTVEQIKQIEKYRPDALVVVDKDENPLFKMTVAKNSKGSLNKYGAAFSTAGTSDGSSTITIDLPEGKYNEAGAQWVAEEFGGPLNFIRKLEENAILQLDDISNEVTEIKNLIQVV